MDFSMAVAKEIPREAVLHRHRQSLVHSLDPFVEGRGVTSGHQDVQQTRCVNERIICNTLLALLGLCLSERSLVNA